jgi:hypothetical protein
MPVNYSSWPLVGGALSRAIGESFSGLTEGALQGEKVRHERAGENLQQQYLQHALQQLAAQQAFQQGTLGYRALQAAEQARRDRALEAQRAETAEDTRAWRQGQEQRYAEDRASRERFQAEQTRRWDREDTERERANKERERERAQSDRERADYQRGTLSARWADVTTRAQRAQAAATKGLSTALSQQQKLQLAALSSTARRLRQEAAFANQAAQLGQKPARDLATIEAELVQVEMAIEDMATQAGGGGAPGAPDAASVAKKWGL